MFAGKKSAQIREILISESAWEEMTCLFAPSLAFLVGPPLLGYLGEHYGLRSAMLVVLALVILAAIVAKAVAKPDTKTQTAMENS